MDEILNEEIHEMYEEHERFSPALDISTLRRSLKMIMKPAISVTQDTPIIEAIQLMQTKRLGCVLIVQKEKLLGIFTERDVLKKIINAPFDLSKTPIEKVMTINPQMLYLDDTLAYALNYMDLGGYRHIPIVNEKHEPVGLVSIKDIISYLVEHFADEILHLPPHPIRSTHSREGA